MSTTIDVYPGDDVMPLVEETRTRAQELFQGLLDRRGVRSTIEVRAFYDGPGESIRYVGPDARWAVGLDLGFGYWIDGVWSSSSWPSCCEWDDDDVLTAEDVKSEVNPGGVSPDLVGRRWIAEPLSRVVSADRLARILRRDHFWREFRSAAGHAVASTGYGLVPAALAEATGGVVASWDSAFDVEHNGESAEQFLTWWGDQQVDFYGEAIFRGTGSVHD